MKALVAIVLGLSLMQAPTQQEPPSRGTATIRGRVIEKESGAPLARAVVSLRGMSRGVVEQNFTNDEGAFEFRQLAAGSYELRASAGEYRATHVSISYRPSTRPGLGPPLQLKDGEERTDIVVALPRAYAISGRVTDEDGTPLANVQITLPRTSFSTDAYDGRPRTTDDNGAFRLYGLGPGRYTICADAGRGPSFDRQSARRLRYVRTCHPSATDASEATEVPLVQGDVDGVEIRMQRRPLFIVAGHVVTADGTPPDNAQIHLTRIEGLGASGTGTRLAANGSFRVSDVVPGTYEVSAQFGRSERSFEPDERQPQWGGVRFDVTTADVDGIVVTLKRGAAVKGSVVYEDPPQAPPTGPVQVMARPANSSTGSRPQAMPATVADDGTFELKGLFGELTLYTGGSSPRGYVLKSVLYKGRDIAFIPTEFDGDPAHQIQVVLTSRTAILSGRVLDDTGAPAAAMVIHFPADPLRRSGFPRGWGSSGEDGRYRIPQVIAGDYLIAAVKPADAESLTLPEDYDRLAAVAERVTVLENDRRTADLPLVSVPPRSRRR